METRSAASRLVASYTCTNRGRHTIRPAAIVSARSPRSGECSRTLSMGPNSRVRRLLSPSVMLSTRSSAWSASEAELLLDAPLPAICPGTIRLW
eukprot:scaffold1380_cov374-Prasinococcus_capsulatus_cf.AAC.6